MPSGALAFTDNPVLFGHDPTTGILRVDPVADGMREYRRGEVTSRPFRPFFWIASPDALAGFDRPVELVSLNGNGRFRTLAVFDTWSDLLAARRRLAAADYFWLSDAVQQYLLVTGRTLFKGLRFAELRRLQIALVTGPDDKLHAIQVCDPAGQVHEWAGDEKIILTRLLEAVATFDPDVLEGHDIFRRLLPQLQQCARRHEVMLSLGRSEGEPTVRLTQIQVAERTIQYPRADVQGRHLVDTFLLAQLYDVATRELAGFELADVATHFGLTGSPVELVRQISDRLSPSYFVQAQIFPYNFQDVIVRGNATKIDALLLREYLHRRHAVPDVEAPQPFAGGYTDVFVTGVVHNVWHADVQSLYPSLLLAYGLKPQRDELGLFLPLVAELRSFRLQAKTAARQAADPAEQQHLAALQRTFKILLNSFYGYLGFAQAHFGDYAVAQQVTARGRELVQRMLQWLRQRGAQVIEVDTDGLYFVPPADVTPEQLEAELQTLLPSGVDVELDAQYPAMFSYKIKNYALLDADGRLHISGSALRSRGLEKFQRQFLEEMLRLALTGRVAELPRLYAAYRHQIEHRQWPIDMFAKTETLRDPPEVYREKVARSQRNRSAAYELALKSSVRFQPGDQISYYVTGQHPHVSVYEHCKRVEEWNPDHRDENVAYYCEKLDALYRKFAPLLGAPAVSADQLGLL